MARPRKRTTHAGARARVDAVRHKDKRKNIPTEELRDFVREEEQQPRKVLYLRDPDLDPQLVWKGKDEQDAHPLEVPAVPIYIQEKIHPQAIIEDFKASAARAKGAATTQPDLFSDFNGLPADFADRVDFYHHEGNWSNRLILGDSLLVMTSLAEKEALKGQVQMIYLDPPYGIKFGSNWQVSTRKRDVRDGKPEDVVRQPEQVKAFRDTWQLGIHSYLSYLRDRLVVARELLAESGSIFVQIGDENVHLVRCVLDEVFGPANFVRLITFAKTGSMVSSELGRTSDYLVWYSRKKDALKYRQLYSEKRPDAFYSHVEMPDGAVRSIAPDEMLNPSVLREGARVFRLVSLESSGPPGEDTPLEFMGRVFRPSRSSHWKLVWPSGMEAMKKTGRMLSDGQQLRWKYYISDYPLKVLSEVWQDTAGFNPEQRYVVETRTKVVERCLLMTTDPGDLVLDPTCGSGTTAYVAEQWGRRWITIDTSRVALTLARTRLMAAKFPYYYLADDYPQAATLTGDEDIKAYIRKNAPAAGSTQDVRKGFLYRRVPHITLKSIANNEEIDTIHAKWQPQVEEALGQLNAALRGHQTPFAVTEGGRAGHEVRFDAPADASFTMPSGQRVPVCELVEWEVPRQAPPDWPAAACKALEEFWRLRQARQKEIDDSIQRRAEYEVLYDQPYEDPKRVRVTGPFTVESLSPHRTISVEDKKALAEKPSEHGFTVKMLAGGGFANLVLDNLRTAGVQNTVRNERLKFDSLSVYPGQWISGEGWYSEKDGTRKRVAVCIGPEHGTVGPELIKEAAKEAVQGVGFDVLIVCGFAFDPHVSEEAKRYGKLVVLPCRMNPDLAMGELLKKTGSGNLFMVFGEPDVAVKKAAGGKLTVEIKGLDVYDPTTGEIRSSSTDDIACWFIDTNYNGESFFVRHAYFTGADQPYDKLKRALRAEVDEAAWSALYSTTSRPFEKPPTGKIAIKVINHYGDEVLKVYEVK